jgi:hypothetical protein
MHLESSVAALISADWLVEMTPELFSIALLRLPKEITREQIDTARALLFYPGRIEADSMWISKVFEIKHRAWSTMITASFDTDELLDAIDGTGRVELVITGQLKSGQYFFGTDTINVIDPGSRRQPRHRLWYDHRWIRRCRR